MVFYFTCEYLYFKIANVIFNSTYSQKNTIITEYINDNGLYDYCNPIIISDHPYNVNVRNTDNIDQKNVSKLFIEKLGLDIPLAHTRPFAHKLSAVHKISVKLPVYKSIHRFCNRPENN